MRRLLVATGLPFALWASACADAGTSSASAPDEGAAEDDDRARDDDKPTSDEPSGPADDASTPDGDGEAPAAEPSTEPDETTLAGDPANGADAGPSDEPSDTAVTGPSDEPSDAADASTTGELPDEPEREYPAGEPGCGLEAAAFCDTFDAPAEKELGIGRSGEADATWWSAARMEPSLNWGDEALAVGPATIGQCRDGLPERVLPDQDVLVCNGNDQIESRHLLVAAAAQNYGQTSLRIRRPFDFSERTGKIVFDAAALPGGLLGWTSVSITEDPSPAPSFAILGNWENGAVPRRGIEVHLNQNCQTEDQISVSQINIFEDWVERFFEPEERACAATKDGHLSHFEIQISKSRIEIWASDASDDGIHFGEPKLLYAQDIELPFERGYVHLSTHNHATLKYSDGGTMDAWIARYDNVGFDGPVISNFREYSVPDALVPLEQDGGEELNLGYQIAPELPEEARTLTLPGVDTAGAIAAHVAFDTRYLMGQGTPYEDFVLRYRLNGGAWHDSPLAQGQLDLLNGPYVYNALGESVREAGEGIAGAMAQWLELELTELVSGDNTIEFSTEGVPTSYRPFVANVDLVLELE